ncbi:AraC family transcriptional regulator [Saccharibacillus sp. CPCC 101409]|uniref:helix-turn-helix domain-containing protein n=1 Tax=Saccharibacillus sp. CPCC 101409 TaxID=3058041 RepID=UPI002672EF9B|nr:AraC family transcriptional regulator [Saccharibacillus sp. CPCC 101409]MDO3410392.1 AraC family transcriptional regulator [Saccharibacillus sp. CPCC 101409]
MNKNVRFIPGDTLREGRFGLYTLKAELPFDYTEIAEPHRHDCFEIFWVTGGSGSARIDFQTYRYSPRSFCLISPGQIHGWAGSESDDPLEGWLLVFSADLLSQTRNSAGGEGADALFRLIGRSPFHIVDAEQAEVLNGLFRLLEREWEGRQLYREEAFAGYLRLLLLEYDRLQDRWERAHREEAGFRLTGQYLNAVEQHYRTPAGVSDYASMLHVTANHLIESVKKTLGKSAGEVLRERQLLEAKRLLRYSSLPIAGIARELGYDDPSYFGRFFKKSTGSTPTEFRKRD